MLLNKRQVQAIHTVQGPCLVLAGAGSGKTCVIINKIVTLINQYGYKASEIFAVTFTNKSAQEMKSRIYKILQTKQNISQKLNIYTFHALGMKIISQSLDLLGYKSDYTLFDSADQTRLIKSIIAQNMRNNHDILKKIISYITYQKNKIITPKQAKKDAVSKQDQIFAVYYDQYNKFLKQNNAFDFDDLIYVAVILLQKHPVIQDKWQNYIKYLLVDEYQDTNFSQYKLIQLLTGSASNFTLVGDDDQSIYAWRGANIDNILFLKRDYPNLQVITMEHNYRSSKRILHIANTLISNNVHIFKKKLFSNLSDGAKIRVLKLKNEYQEAKKIIDDILLHKVHHGMNYHDYAILYRTNQQAKIFEKYLFQKQIPYFIHGNNSFFNRSEIKNLISYLKFFINQYDNISLIRIINIPARNIGINTVKKIVKYANDYNKDYFSVIQDDVFKNTLHSYVRKRLDKFTVWVKNIMLFFKEKPTQILYKIMHDTQYEKWLIKSNKNNYQKCIQNVHIFLDWTKAFFKQYSEKYVTLNTYDILVQLVNQFVMHDININANHTNECNAIQLMTMHASKGLEFPIVFIVGSEEGIIPSYQQIHVNNIAEERRLIYVAITRAKTELTFSYCHQRSCYNEIIQIQPSRFLFELPRHDLIWINIV
ncbi:UvrD-helicase domain-containing protein [Buchnera aphidicola (Takecallis taiwana)]|uniref:UvrD-helicase domain-containing protein n=1 Tax=Buchnera aphidicola TaxID=9 RepID=UPI0031B72A1B